LNKASTNLELLHRRVFLLLSAILIAGYLLGFQLSQNTQLLVLLLSVSLTGVPHGALDPLVARQANLWQGGAELLVFGGVYLLIASAVFGLWMIFSDSILAALLIMSVWHFSGDWRESLPRSQCLALAAAVICAPGFWHTAEVTQLFSYLAPASSLLFSTIMLYLTPLCMLIAIAALLGKSKPITYLRIEFAALMVGAAVLPPLLFFLLYFCLLHSPRHLLAVTRGLKLKEIVYYGLFFTGLTLALAVILFFVLPETGIGERLTQVLFIGLLALTVPHMLITECMTNNRQKHFLRSAQ
jgi:Brp/Blh family beta-carotene 15,15'-monooxygenase